MNNKQHTLRNKGPDVEHGSHDDMETVETFESPFALSASCGGSLTLLQNA